MIRSPSFKPHFMPIRYGRASLISSSLFRLFASSFLLFCRSVSSARCPASSFSFFTAVSKSCSPGSGRLAAMYRFLFPFPHGNTFRPRPSPRCSGRPDGRSTNKLPRHPLPTSRRTHQTPWTIRNPPACRTSVHDNPVSSSNIHKSRCCLYAARSWKRMLFCTAMESLPYPQQFHTAIGKHHRQ